MKDERSTAKYFQFQLPLDNTARKQRKAPGLHARYKSRATSKNMQSPSSRGTSRSQSSHDCITIDYENDPSLHAQHILVGSALRRPHATQFSPLDSQTMPDVGRSPRQPYKSQSSCTVFTYAARPVSARSEPAHFGQHTKSSLLRCKSASSLISTSSISSPGCDATHGKSHCNKKLCKIWEDYRFFNTGSFPKQNPPHGESMHAFLTGARYNRTRFLDSRSLSRLGVYIPKADLNTFLVNEEKAAGQYSDDDDIGISNETSPDGSSSELDAEQVNKPTQNKAINTEPHFLSISNWQPAEWKTNRKDTREPRVTSAPVRIKPIKAYYYDYDKAKRKRPATSVQKEKRH